MPHVLRRLAATVTTTALLALPAGAGAAGLWNFDQGAANYARGGANIAAPADPTAIYLNPAALAGQRGYQFFVMADFLDDQRAFQRSPDRIGRPRFCCRETRYDPVANEHPVFPPSPGIYLAGNFAQLGLPQLTIGLAMYGPPRSDATLDPGGAQRYSLIESHHLQIHTALSAGYELPWRKIRLGLTAMTIDQVIDTQIGFNTFLGFAEERGWDADVDVKARDSGIPTFILGASVEAIPQVTLAASYQHEYDVKAEGRAKGEVGAALDEIGRMRNGDLTVELQMPSIARGALRFDAPGGGWDAEAAFVYESWSRNDAIEFKPKQPGGLALVLDDGFSRSVGDLTVPTHYRDTWSVRLGGQWNAKPGVLAVRAGTFYERAAIAPERINMGNFDLDKVGVSTGVRWDVKNRAWVEVGGGYQHWLPVETGNSRVRIIDPLTNEERWPIGNGRYTNRRIHAVLGVGVRI